MTNLNEIDVTGISYFLPVISFVLVFIVTYAVLNKTKLFGDKGIELFVSFLISTLFISAVGSIEYLGTIVPWFAVLMVCLFLIFIFTGFIGDGAKSIQKGFGIFFVVILFIVFIVAAFFVFSSNISPYLPGGDDSGANQNIMSFFNWLFSSKVGGAIILLLVSGLVSWVLVKSGGK